MPKNQRKDGSKQLDKRIGLIEALAEFEKFREEILPMLMDDIAKGISPAEMRKKYQSYLAARQISEALTNPDASVALQAIKDLSDRNEGKPKETKELLHKYKDLPDDQLDALLHSEQETLDDILN